MTVDNKTVQLISQAYDLGKIHSVTLLPSDPSTIAANLHTDSGVWFIKRHPAKTTITDIRQEFDLLYKLKQAGFQLSNLPISTSDDSIAITLNNEVWTVQKSINCDHNFQWTVPTWKEKHCYQAGQALAMLHHAGVSIDSPLPVFARDSLIDPLKLSISSFIQNHPKSKFQTELQNLSAAGFQELVAEINQLESRSTIHRTIIHGDFHPGNVLYHQGQAKAIIDFNYARADNPLFDLGYALMMFCADWGTSTIKESFKSALLSGYGDVLNNYHDTKLSSLLNQTPLLNLYAKLSCCLILLWALEGQNQSSLDYNRVIQHALSVLHGLYSE